MPPRKQPKTAAEKAKAAAEAEEDAWLDAEASRNQTLVAAAAAAAAAPAVVQTKQHQVKASTDTASMLQDGGQDLISLLSFSANPDPAGFNLLTTLENMQREMEEAHPGIQHDAWAGVDMETEVLRMMGVLTSMLPPNLPKTRPITAADEEYSSKHGADHCWSCQAGSARLACSGCVVRYCNEECANQSWKRHQDICEKINWQARDFDRNLAKLDAGTYLSEMSGRNVSNLIRDAGFFGRLNDLETLVAMGGDVNHLADNDSCTPLHYALQEGHFRMVKALLRHGARVDVEVNGFLPLSLAAQFRDVKSATALLDAGALVDSGGSSVSGPLHTACRKGSLEMAILLLERNANPFQRASDETRPAEIAMLNGHKAVERLVMKKMVEMIDNGHPFADEARAQIDIMKAADRAKGANYDDEDDDDDDDYDDDDDDDEDDEDDYYDDDDEDEGDWETVSDEEEEVEVEGEGEEEG